MFDDILYPFGKKEIKEKDETEKWYTDGSDGTDFWYADHSTENKSDVDLYYKLI